MLFRSYPAVVATLDDASTVLLLDAAGLATAAADADRQDALVAALEAAAVGHGLAWPEGGLVGD